MSVEQDQAATSPVLNEIDNLAIYLTNGKMDETGFPNFIAGIAAEPKLTGEASIVSLLPLEWKGDFVMHFQDALPLTGGKRVEDLERDEISHLVLLESKLVHGDPLYFAGDAIKGDSLLVWYSEKRNKFYHIHCRKCCYKILNWMVAQQEEWKRCPAPSSTRN